MGILWVFASGCTVRYGYFLRNFSNNVITVHIDLSFAQRQFEPRTVRFIRDLVPIDVGTEALLHEYLPVRYLSERAIAVDIPPYSTVYFNSLAESFEPSNLMLPSHVRLISNGIVVDSLKEGTYEPTQGQFRRVNGNLLSNARYYDHVYDRICIAQPITTNEAAILSRIVPNSTSWECKKVVFYQKDLGVICKSQFFASIQNEKNTLYYPFTNADRQLSGNFEGVVVTGRTMPILPCALNAIAREVGTR